MVVEKCGEVGAGRRGVQNSLGKKDPLVWTFCRIFSSNINILTPLTPPSPSMRLRD